MRTRLSSQVVGPAVRKLRLSKGLTLAELSESSGVPLSTLSKLELGQAALTYDKMVRLCRALEVDLEKTMRSEAQAAPVAAGRRSVTRAGEGEGRAYGPHRARLAAADLLSKAMTPYILDISVKTLEEHGPFQRIESEACLVILSGVVALHSELYAPLFLSAGDCVYFDGRTGHAMLNAGGETARALVTAAGEVAV